jgi:type III secretion protein V
MSIQRFFASSDTVATRGLVSRFSDLALVAGVVAIVALMILPLPALLIDLLVAANITFGVTLLLTTLYIRGALDFSSFPSILLISTLFRLALSIATTRMILIEAHGGHIIQTFGTMVAGGNIVVGLVVFLIITIVQFIVIAKGAERVAEVAARFSLDSMPGKQLSIDSDLRSGLIDKDDARRRRRILEQESKLHGSLDGAMKFVKGDAIASIVIVVVNLIGGLAIGVMQKDMALGEATAKYSILTIGEGLVAQIPALLGAMAAGLMVTRTTDEEATEHLGESMARQLTANPRVPLAVGAICFLMALVPGFPTTVFILLGFGGVLTGSMLHPRLRPHVVRHSGPLRRLIRQDKPTLLPATLDAAPALPRPVVPLLLEVTGRPPSEPEGRALAEGLTAMLDRLQYRSGVPLPKLAIHFDRSEADTAWRLLAFELPIGSGTGLDAEAVVTAVEAALRRNLTRFIGVQEAVTLLNRVGDDYPEVVKEAVRALPAARIAEVLRRLVDEEVSIRNMRDLLEGLTVAFQQARDDDGRLADLTRVALKRYTLDAYARDGTLRALVVQPDLETMIQNAAHVIDGVERVALQPEVARDLVQAIGQMAHETGADVLVTSIEVRRTIRKLIEPVLFDLPVLAFNELSPNVRMDVRGHIGLPEQRLTDETNMPLAAE